MNHPDPSAGPLADAVVALVSRIPATVEQPGADVASRVAELRRAAARRAAVVSGGLALPGGPVALVTLVPDLLAIWRIQAQLVADIAGARGRAGSLTREQMLYCLFRHAASHLLRDVVVRAGGRLVVRRLSGPAAVALASRVGVHLSREAVARGVGRVVPGLGAAAVAAYAWWDTDRVARTADELLTREWMS